MDLIVIILGVIAAIFWIIGLLQVFLLSRRISGKLGIGFKLLIFSAFLNFVVVVLFLLTDYNFISVYHRSLINRTLLIISAIVFTFGIRKIIKFLDYIPESLKKVLSGSKEDSKDTLRKKK